MNPNTVSRAYTELELTGLVETQMGSGTFVGQLEVRETRSSTIACWTNSARSFSRKPPLTDSLSTRYSGTSTAKQSLRKDQTMGKQSMSLGLGSLEHFATSFRADFRFGPLNILV